MPDGRKRRVTGGQLIVKDSITEESRIVPAFYGSLRQNLPRQISG